MPYFLFSHSQVNEISLSGLDNIKAISVLKKSDASITLKLKRYLCGFLCKELKKAGITFKHYN